MKGIVHCIKVPGRDQRDSYCIHRIISCVSATIVRKNLLVEVGLSVLVRGHKGLPLALLQEHAVDAFMPMQHLWAQKQ